VPPLRGGWLELQPGARAPLDSRADRRLCLLDEANVPAQGSAVVLLEVSGSEEESYLQRFSEADEVELRGGRECFRDVAAVQGSTETHARRALSDHERMFAYVGGAGCKTFEATPQITDPLPLER
jgi:hypothetical protein